MDNNIIYDTGYISLIIQLITGIVGAIGIFIPLNSKDKILTDIIIMETVVQFIEFLFYIWLVFSIYARTANVTSIRYFDWFITTPIMLLTTVLYMAYNSNNSKYKDNNDNITLISIIKKDYKIISAFITLNFFMLLFGLLGELGLLNRNIALFLGSIFFILSFYIIYKYYALLDDDNKPLFYFIFIVWSLYGVAFLFNYKYRNVFYNGLDIISKNFYGLYIFYKIMKIKNRKVPKV